MLAFIAGRTSHPESRGERRDVEGEERG